jgi:hypothetical protein
VVFISEWVLNCGNGMLVLDEIGLVGFGRMMIEIWNFDGI